MRWCGGVGLRHLSPNSGITGSSPTLGVQWMWVLCHFLCECDYVWMNLYLCWNGCHMIESDMKTDYIFNVSNHYIIITYQISYSLYDIWFQAQSLLYLQRMILACSDHSSSLRLQVVNRPLMRLHRVIQCTAYRIIPCLHVTHQTLVTQLPEVTWKKIWIPVSTS